MVSFSVKLMVYQCPYSSSSTMASRETYPGVIRELTLDQLIHVCSMVGFCNHEYVNLVQFKNDIQVIHVIHVEVNICGHNKYSVVSLLAVFTSVLYLVSNP